MVLSSQVETRARVRPRTRGAELLEAAMVRDPVRESLKYRPESTTEKNRMEEVTITRYGYTGREHDAVISTLVYFRSRYFSTKLGRFLSHDAKYYDGWNLYAGYFAMKMRRDPMGKEATDGGFEGTTGVGNAITQGTMVQEPQIMGKTFSGENCECTAAFTFDKAYKGTYIHGINKIKVKGVYVKMSVRIKDRSKCCCDSIKLVQAYDEWRLDAAGKYQSTVVDPSDPDRILRSGMNDPRAANPGWSIDAGPGIGADPLWGTNSPEFDGNNGQSPTPAGASQPAELWDPPGEYDIANAPAKNMGARFETCAICEKNEKNTIIGCVTWGYYIDRNGAIEFNPNPPTASCTAGSLMHALNRWNAIPGAKQLPIDRWGTGPLGD